MLVPYEIPVTTLGEALAIVQQQAYADGWVHIGISSMHRSGPESWIIVITSPANYPRVSGE